MFAVRIEQPNEADCYIGPFRSDDRAARQALKSSAQAVRAGHVATVVTVVQLERPAR